MPASTDRSTVWLCHRAWGRAIVGSALATETPMMFRLDERSEASGYSTRVGKSDVFATRKAAVEAGRAYLADYVETCRENVLKALDSLAAFDAKESP